jgi:hypothetical protein
MKTIPVLQSTSRHFSDLFSGLRQSLLKLQLEQGQTLFMRAVLVGGAPWARTDKPDPGAIWSVVGLPTIHRGGWFYRKHRANTDQLPDYKNHASPPSGGKPPLLMLSLSPTP